jgi:polar amino acid transport system permease protein
LNRRGHAEKRSKGLSVRTKGYRLSLLDLMLLLLIAAALIYLGYRIKIGLHYRWNWGAMPRYLFRYDAASARWVPNVLTEGLITTIRLSFWATLIAIAFGTIGGFFRMSGSLFKRLVGRTFVELLRNTPPLVLIFIFYYFISSWMMPLLGVDEHIRSASPAIESVLSILFAPPQRLTAFISAMLTVALFEAAYIAEIVRAGIQSVDRGQFEASDALGLSWWRKMRHVILPQAVPRILPPLAGQFISTIKDSAIVSVISIPDLTFQGMQLMSTTYLIFECWITITLLYLIMTLTLSLAVNRLEVYLKRKSFYAGRG